MTNQEKEKLIVDAIEDLNKYKHLDIILDNIIPIQPGHMKVVIAARKMKCPGAILIANNTFESSIKWKDDEAAGITKLLNSPNGLNEDTCIKLRVAYLVYKVYCSHI